VVVGFWTFPKTTVWAPVGAATLPDLLMRKLPAVLVLTVHPEASPKLVGWEDSVDEELENPVTELQAPEAVVQMSAAIDCKTVPEGTVKLNV